MNPFSHTGLSISDSLKSVRKSVIIYETIIEKLTPTILNDMVNAVYVHAPDKSSGHRVQDVTISYNYIGILPANLLYDVMNGKAA